MTRQKKRRVMLVHHGRTVEAGDVGVFQLHGWIERARLRSDRLLIAVEVFLGRKRIQKFYCGAATGHVEVSA